MSQSGISAPAWPSLIEAKSRQSVWACCAVSQTQAGNDRLDRVFLVAVHVVQAAVVSTGLAAGRWYVGAIRLCKRRLLRVVENLVLFITRAYARFVCM